VNTDASWPDLDEAEWRVLKIQTKLHQRAADDPHRRFDDLFNLVADPAFLVVAWDRVRGNRGSRSAGVDGVAPRSIVFGKEETHSLQLPVEDGAGSRQGEGAGADAGQQEPDPRQPPATGEPGAAGLGQLLPSRGVGKDLRLSQRLQLASGRHLAPPQAPTGIVEVASTTLPTRVASDRGRGDASQPDVGAGHPLPISGCSHPLAVGDSVKR